MPLAHEEADQARLAVGHLVRALRERHARAVHDREVVRHAAVEADEAVVENADFVGLVHHCAHRVQRTNAYGRSSRPPSTTMFWPVTKSGFDAEPERLGDVGRARRAGRARSRRGSRQCPRASAPARARRRTRGSRRGPRRRPGTSPGGSAPPWPRHAARTSGHGWSPATSVIATITPPPAAAITRCAAWAANMKPLARRVDRRVPEGLVDIGRRRAARTRRTGSGRRRRARRSASAAALDHRGHVERVGGVGPDDARAAAERLDVGPRLLGRSGRAVVAHEDVRAARGQVERERSADAVRAAGDEDPAAVDGGHVGIC